MDSALINENIMASVGSEQEKDIPNTRMRQRFRITVEPALFGFFLAQTFTSTVFTNLVLLKTCEVTLNYNSTICDELISKTNDSDWIETIVQPHASVILMGSTLISSVLPALLSIFLGPWSDNNGRKLPLCAPALGAAITFFLYAGLSAISTLDPRYLLLANIPQSLMGGYINFVTAAYCYITDITLEDERAKRLTLGDLFFFVGTLIGSAAVAPIFDGAGQYGYITVFCIGGTVSLACFIYTLFLPETVDQTENGKGLKGLFNFKLVKEMFETCFKKRDNKVRSTILCTVVALSTAMITAIGENSVSFLFTRKKFEWTLGNFTYWSAVRLISTIVGSAIGTWFLSWNKRVPDVILGIFTFSTKVIECMSLGLVPRDKSYLFYVFSLFGMFGGVNGALCRSILSKSVPKTEIGKVLALTSSLEAIMPLAASPLYTLVYNDTLESFPGTFYFLSSSIFLIDAILLCIVLYNQLKTRQLYYSHVDGSES